MKGYSKRSRKASAHGINAKPADAEDLEDSVVFDLLMFRLLAPYIYLHIICMVQVNETSTMKH